jgi:hypothetical protein
VTGYGHAGVTYSSNPLVGTTIAAGAAGEWLRGVRSRYRRRRSAF